MPNCLTCGKYFKGCCGNRGQVMCEDHRKGVVPPDCIDLATVTQEGSSLKLSMECNGSWSIVSYTEPVLSTSTISMSGRLSGTYDVRIVVNERVRIIKFNYVS